MSDILKLVLFVDGTNIFLFWGKGVTGTGHFKHVQNKKKSGLVGPNLHKTKMCYLVTVMYKCRYI